MNTNKYGDLYFCVTTKKTDVFLFADSCEVTGAGDLVFRRKDGQINYIFAHGQWRATYSASCLDGGAVCLDHWEPIG